jgi:hypothetical protein
VRKKKFGDRLEDGFEDEGQKEAEKEMKRRERGEN